MKIKKLVISLLALAMIASLCAVSVMADGANDNVIFICDNAQGDGSSADSPLKPTTGNYDTSLTNADKFKDAALYQAWEKLMAKGGGTIVICGPYTLDDSNCRPVGKASCDFIMDATLYKPDITITYTSVWDGVDYRTTNNAELVMAGKSHLTFPTGTVIQDLTVRATNENPDHFLCGGVNPLTLSKGTNFIPFEEGNPDAYPIVVGAFRNNNVGIKEGDTNILIDIGDENTIGKVFGSCNGGNGKHSGNMNITIKSGNIDGVYGDSRCISQVPIMGDVNINLEGGSYRGLVAGVNVGFAGKCDKVVNLKITGGNFENCLGVQAYTSTADAVMPEVFNVDCSGAPMETANQIKNVVDFTANLIMPDSSNQGNDDPATGDPEPSQDATEGNSNEESKAPATDKPATDKPASNNTWIYIVAAVAVVAVVVVVIVVIKKKK